jgi:DNA-binding transcriptional MocR family regulator
MRLSAPARLQLNGEDPIPLYFRLKILLSRGIESLAHPPGRRLPSERRLAEIYGVSQVTVRQALESMRRESAVRRARISTREQPGGLQRAAAGWLGRSRRPRAPVHAPRGRGVRAPPRSRAPPAPGHPAHHHRVERNFEILSEEARARLLADMPLGRFAEPPDLSSVVGFLTSDGDGFITGATVDVNGGYVMV